MATAKDKRTRIERAHIGTMGWSYKFWMGNFYPKGLKTTEFLTEYSKHFNSVELDNTFYRIPSTDLVKTWKKQTPEDFLFSAKFPRIITHVKMLEKCEKDVERFLSSMSQLQGKLGLLLLQFPPSFGQSHFSLLQDFLSSLPREHRYAVEVRNEGLRIEKLYLLLREHGVALALTNLPGTAQIDDLTANFVYVRWEGDRRKVNGTLGKVEVDRSKELKEWAYQVKAFLDRQIEVFGYFSKYYSGYPPSDAEQFLKLLLN
jgi:uncharacterized protein YecE (DUF72 family)